MSRNSESDVTYRRKRYAADSERFKAEAARYRVEHPDRVRDCSKRYRAANKGAIEVGGRERRWRLRLEVVAAYGGACACCGETEPKFLCIDHVYGDGKVDRANGYAGVHLFAKLRKEGYPKDGYRLLCHNCNAAFRLLGTCPHRARKFGEEAVG